MDPFAGLTVLRPALLWLLILVPIAVFFFLSRESLRRRLADRFISEGLRGFEPVRSLRPWLLGGALLALAISLSGPSAGSEPVSIERREGNLIVALDVSSSMDAEDVGVSRLSLARSTIRSLVGSWEGRAALLAFEGYAEVVAPLTSDGEAINTLLDSLEAGELGEPGSDLSGAIDESVRTALTGGAPEGVIVLVSDGEHRSGNLDRSLALARARSLPVITVTVGTPLGGRIPDGDGRFLRDDSGTEIHTKASDVTMKRIASETGGATFSNPANESDLRALRRTAERLAAGKSKARKTVVPKEQYQWTLAAAIGLLFAASMANRGIE